MFCESGAQPVALSLMYPCRARHVIPVSRKNLMFRSQIGTGASLIGDLQLHPLEQAIQLTGTGLWIAVNQLYNARSKF